jgi:hypothetical protein
MREVLDILGWTAQRRQGEQCRGRCPLPTCPNTRPLCCSVNLRKHAYRCFQCESCGNALDLWTAASGLPLKLAALTLCHRLGKPLPSTRNPKTPPLQTTNPRTPGNLPPPIQQHPSPRMTLYVGNLCYDPIVSENCALTHSSKVLLPTTVPSALAGISISIVGIHFIGPSRLQVGRTGFWKRYCNQGCSAFALSSAM